MAAGANFSNTHLLEFLQRWVSPTPSFLWLGVFSPGDSATSNFFNVRISPTLIFPLTWSFSPEDSVTSNFPDGKCLQCWILLWLGVFSLRNFVASNFSDVEFLQHPLAWSFLTWRFSNLEFLRHWVSPTTSQATWQISAGHYSQEIPQKIPEKNAPTREIPGKSRQFRKIWEPWNSIKIQSHPLHHLRCIVIFRSQSF